MAHRHDVGLQGGLDGGRETGESRVVRMAGERVGKGREGWRERDREREGRMAGERDREREGKDGGREHQGKEGKDGGRELREREGMMARRETGKGREGWREREREREGSDGGRD